MTDDTAFSDPVHAWNLLHSHPALSWTPPMWRSAEDDAYRARTAPHVVRAVERNLLVNVRPGQDCRYVVALSTGPLEDRPLGDGIDPVAPAARRDPRLDVEAQSFETALCALARRVVDVYGPPGGSRAAPSVRPAAYTDEL